MRRRDPNQLTNREREVLDLLRRDFTNEQIAQRLGISVDGAKYHVSQILSKLGVATREEAAALAIGERGRWWAGWPLAAKLAGAATMVAALAGLAVLAWGVLRTGEQTDAQRAPASSSPVAVIPWSDIPAPDVAEPFTIPDVPACRADELNVTVEGSGGPKDTLLWGIIVENMSSGSCFVGSAIQVNFGTLQANLDLPAERTGGEIVYLEPGPPFPGISTPSPRFSFKAGGSISLYSCDPPAITQLEISPGPALGTVTLDPGDRTLAGDTGMPCRVAAQTYRAQLFPEDCCSGSGLETETWIEAPATARVGQRLRFLITVTNRPWETSKPAPLPGSVVVPPPLPPPLEWSPCPTYHQELQGVPGTFRTYRLNCEQVAPLQPNASATFEMYIDVPADAQPGPSVLTWRIDGSETMYNTASVNIWIEP